MAEESAVNYWEVRSGRGHVVLSYLTLRAEIRPRRVRFDAKSGPDVVRAAV
jgi:hypothetical protein